MEDGIVSPGPVGVSIGIFPGDCRWAVQRIPGAGGMSATTHRYSVDLGQVVMDKGGHVDVSLGVSLGVCHLGFACPEPDAADQALGSEMLVMDP